MKNDKKIIFKTLQALICMSVSFILVHILEKAGIANQTYLVVILMGIITTVFITDNGIIAAAVSILSASVYGYFYNDPIFKLAIDADYIVSFIVFLAVALISSGIMYRLRRATENVNRERDINNKISMLSTTLVNNAGIDIIIKYVENILSEVCGAETVLLTGKKLCSSDEAAMWCIDNLTVCGKGTEFLSDSENLYIPFEAGGGEYGAAAVYSPEQGIAADKERYFNTVLGQLSIALDRNYLLEQEKINRFRIEQEKFKSDLLRSVSHDLRTPLTVIRGNAELIKRNSANIDTETLNELTDSILADAEWLRDMTENLLNMTRIQDGGLKINMKPQTADDILSNVASRVCGRIGRHTFRTERPDKILFVNADAYLLTQALVNLIDNAFVHTRPDSEIILTCFLSDTNVVFRVRDNGGGISEDSLDRIFEAFYTTAGGSDKCRGTGLGLSICKSITEAHGGVIKAENNSCGGADFTVILQGGMVNEQIGTDY